LTGGRSVSIACAEISKNDKDRMTSMAHKNNLTILLNKVFLLWLVESVHGEYITLLAVLQSKNHHFLPQYATLFNKIIKNFVIQSPAGVRYKPRPCRATVQVARGLFENI